MNELLLILIIIIIIIINNYSKDNFENAFQDKTFEKKIYTYLDNNSSKLEILNIENLKKNTTNDWQIIILNDKNLDNYVDKKFIEKTKNISLKKFIKLLSLQIIYQRGGIWIDPNINILNGIYFNNYYTEMFYQGFDCCIFEIKYDKYDFYKKNFIIMGPSKSNYLKVLLSKLFFYYSINFNDYLIKYIPKNIISQLKVIPTNQNDIVNLIYYNNIILEFNNKYDIIKRNDKNKIFYGIKLSKINKINILNSQINNYKFMKI